MLGIVLGDCTHANAFAKMLRLASAPGALGSFGPKLYFLLPDALKQFRRICTSDHIGVRQFARVLSHAQ